MLWVGDAVGVTGWVGAPRRLAAVGTGRSSIVVAFSGPRRRRELPGWPECRPRRQSATEATGNATTGKVVCHTTGGTDSGATTEDYQGVVCRGELWLEIHLPRVPDYIDARSLCLRPHSHVFIAARAGLIDGRAVSHVIDPFTGVYYWGLLSPSTGVHRHACRAYKLPFIAVAC
jgi:hypothetical protein